MAAVSPAALLHLELLPTSIAPLLSTAPRGDGSSVLAALAAAPSKPSTATLFRDPSMDLLGAGLPLRLLRHSRRLARRARSRCAALGQSVPFSCAKIRPQAHASAHTCSAHFLPCNRAYPITPPCTPRLQWWADGTTLPRSSMCSSPGRQIFVSTEPARAPLLAHHARRGSPARRHTPVQESRRAATTMQRCRRVASDGERRAADGVQCEKGRGHLAALLVLVDNDGRDGVHVAQHDVS